MELIYRSDAINAANDAADDWDGGPNKGREEIIRNGISAIPSVSSVPLEPLCELLAEMYHCPASGRPSSNHACHPDCPDEAFENLCGTDCDNYTDAERWKVFLKHWMEEQR